MSPRSLGYSSGPQELLPPHITPPGEVDYFNISSFPMPDDADNGLGVPIPELVLSGRQGFPFNWSGFGRRQQEFADVGPDLNLPRGGRVELVAILANLNPLSPPWKMPGSWLEENKVLLKQGIDFLGPVYANHFNPMMSCVCQLRFVMYTFAHLKQVADIKLMEDFIGLFNTWTTWCTLDTLENYQTINETLWKFFQTTQDQPVSSDELSELQKLLSSDIFVVCAQLGVILMPGQDECNEFLSKRDRQAQSLLDLLQLLLDWPELDSDMRPLFLTSLLKLSKKSGLYPECLTLTGVELLGQYAVASGGFGDIWKGSGQDQAVSVKVVRMFVKSDIDKLLKDFSHEAIIWQQLSHPNVLPFYGVYHMGPTDQRICLISPWMENGNVAQFLKQKPDAHRPTLVLDIAHGLEYLHKKKTIYG